MNRPNKYIVIVFTMLMFILNSCQEPEIFFEYYPDGNVKEKIISINENNNEFIRLIYYQTGELQDSQYYYNNVLTGLRKYWQYQDTVYKLVEYENDSMTGYYEIYSLNNNILAKGKINENGDNVGEWLFYFENGDLYGYKYYNYLGELAYFQYMNEDGTIKTFSGAAIVNVITLRDTIGINEEIEVEFELIQPPGIEINLKLGNLISEDSIYYYKTVIDAKTPIGFADIYHNEGEHIKVFDWEIVNKISGEKINGQNRMKIMVKEN